MRKLALSAAAAATLIAGAATAAFASPAGSTLPAGAGAQPAAEQVQYDGRGDCYWRDGRRHCDRGYHRGWWGYRDWRWRRDRDRW
jgi:hypothetical protein